MDFTIRIFENYFDETDIHAPVINPLYEFAVRDVGHGDTEITVDARFCDCDEVYGYSFKLPSPLTLAPHTTYWLSTLNDTAADIDDGWRWSSDDAFDIPADRISDDERWSVDGSHMGFQLTNDRLAAIPEPPSTALFIAGLLGLGWLNSRRKP